MIEIARHTDNSHREDSIEKEPLGSSSSSRTTPNLVELQLVNGFPAYKDIEHGDLLSLSLSTNTSRHTHGLHRFPAKYIPQIPRWVIEQFAQPDSIILDPFMGSGTSLVEGISLIEKTYGIDIDPLARFISQAKTAKYDLSELNRLSQELLVIVEELSVDSFLPMTGVKNITHWFKEDTWLELSQLFSAIEMLKCSQTEQNFFYCVFSSILRWVSNADDQTQKTYVSGTLIKTAPSAMDTFRKFLNKAILSVAELEAHRGSGTASILDGSALSIPLSNNSVDLVVTSPPYLDSVDYMYNFMLEYFWLGPKLGVASRADYNLRRRSPVGAKNPLEKIDELPPELLKLLNVNEFPKYRQKAIAPYFSSMRAHFEEAARVMKPGARYVLVVGNSQATTGVIPVHDCLLRLAESSGLHLEKAFAYRVRRHYMKFPRKGRGGIILIDWIITLRKTDRATELTGSRLPIPDITISDDEVAH